VCGKRHAGHTAQLSSLGGTHMGQTKLDLEVTYFVSGHLRVLYRVINERGNELPEWGGYWDLTREACDTPQAQQVFTQLDNLARILGTYLYSNPVATPHGTLSSVKLPLTSFSLTSARPDSINLYAERFVKSVALDELSPDHNRLVGDILASLESETWREIRRRHAKLQGIPLTEPEPIKIFISYRKTKKAHAEAIARRLLRERIEPLWDEWRIQAGDSITEGIDKMFAESRACLILWSQDSPTGNWCTKELHTALSKAVRDKYRVIPVRLDNSPMPDLLSELKWIDLSDWDSQFETGMREIIQVVLGVEPRPR